MTKAVSVFCVLAACFLVGSCEKLPTTETGPLTWKTVGFTDAVPKEYGSLIAVTANSQNPTWAYLWFQQPDGTITVTFVDIAYGKINNRSLTIPRK
jgi:hypothetical protein